MSFPHINRKFNLSYSLLTEAPLSHLKVAGTQKIKINVSPPGGLLSFLYHSKFNIVQEKNFIYTHHIQIKIRNTEKPQDPKSFLNKTTALAIMLHELAHLEYKGHGLDFMKFLRDLYQYCSKMKIFPEPIETHMIPSIREVERVIYERKGNVTDAELLEIFERNL